MKNKLTSALLTSPALLAKYAAHKLACARVGIEPEQYQTFAADVLQTPAANRADVLTIDQPQPYEPLRSYPLYTLPVQAELNYKQAAARKENKENNDKSKTGRTSGA